VEPNALNGWKPVGKRTYEDELLLRYWETVGGAIFSEVLVGKGGTKQWPAGAKPRRIDGVRIASRSPEMRPPGITVFRRSNAREFERIVTGADVEVIEVKRSLDRVVLGQVIIGADLLEMEYEPHYSTQVVVCKDTDPVLEAVCERRGIRVWTPE
jgi:hypothetical protein